MDQEKSPNDLKRTTLQEKLFIFTSNVLLPVMDFYLNVTAATALSNNAFHIIECSYIWKIFSAKALAYFIYFAFIVN